MRSASKCPAVIRWKVLYFSVLCVEPGTWIYSEAPELIPHVEAVVENASHSRNPAYLCWIFSLKCVLIQHLFCSVKGMDVILLRDKQGGGGGSLIDTSQQPCPSFNVLHPPLGARRTHRPLTARGSQCSGELSQHMCHRSASRARRRNPQRALNPT